MADPSRIMGPELRLVVTAPEPVLARDTRPSIIHVVSGRHDVRRMAPVHAALAETLAVAQVVVEVAAGVPVAEARVRDAYGVGEPREVVGLDPESPTRQTAAMLVELERVLIDHAPDVVVVYGGGAAAF